jgi:uncharacterized 2Fe-2S/4Fe-4S cluster protein (DUF4445 family)
MSHGKTLKVRSGESLADKIHEAGINLSLYCQKRGLCGKCFVKILEGELPPPNPQETSLLKLRGFARNSRLACLFKIESDLAISIPSSSLLQEASILDTGLESNVSLDPALKKYYLELEKPGISSPASLYDSLCGKLRIKSLALSLNLLRRIRETLERGAYRLTVVVFDERELLDVEPGDTRKDCYGLAIDLGTTTVVASLVNLATGALVGSTTALNGQAKFGADVISRITYALSGSGHRENLQTSIVETLNGMITVLCRQNRVSASRIYEVVLAGNTAMSHFLLGLPVDSLGIAPYNAVFSRLPSLPAADIGFKINSHAKAYFSPNIRSFVGGDISAGLIASGLARRDGGYLYVDLGTNGEIVAKAGRRLWTTSTAAGPAFEGMSIQCGMLALPGAIYKAEKGRDSKLRVFTIGKKPAKGICGTGLIDLAALSLGQRKISPGGAIQNKNKRLAVTGRIFLSQSDIRELQLAVAAIKTGMQMMLSKSGQSLDGIEAIMIAGAFGNYLSIPHSQIIGLLPRIDARKVIFIGNASLAGAKALLLSREARKEAESLAERVSYISLAKDPAFQEYFIRSLKFGEW